MLANQLDELAPSIHSVGERSRRWRPGRHAKRAGVSHSTSIYVLVYLFTYWSQGDFEDTLFTTPNCDRTLACILSMRPKQIYFESFKECLGFIRVPPKFNLRKDCTKSIFLEKNYWDSNRWCGLSKFTPQTVHTEIFNVPTNVVKCVANRLC